MAPVTALALALFNTFAEALPTLTSASSFFNPDLTNWATALLVEAFRANPPTPPPKVIAAKSVGVKKLRTVAPISSIILGS